jgi:hypothetical protein
VVIGNVRDLYYTSDGATGPIYPDSYPAMDHICEKRRDFADIELAGWRGMSGPVHENAMSQMNPITGSLMQEPIVQRGQAMDKARQIRSAQDSRKNSAATGEEEVEESVASPDELPPVGDEHHKGQNRKNTYTRQRPPEPEVEDEGNGLDLTA